MNLVRAHWTIEDGAEFKEYLNSFARDEKKREWEKNIVNTQLPCLAVLSPDIKRITKDIAKGNFIEYINLWLWDNFALVNIIGGLICKIDDFECFKKYLYRYGARIDSWGNADLLKFNITEATKQQYFDLSRELIKNEKTYLRRIGMLILFKFVSDDLYIDRILETINNFYDEKEYYVNMVNAWLIAECFTKQRDKTLEMLKNHNLNKFTVNKAISKCRDSFRVSTEDKEMLLSFKAI